ncbi:MAG: GerMN domain-containing protein [Lachnospiraceae bacterium]|nr:GerMN domain-containing protein [Lachnospiraceae bacterium]
MNGMKRMLTAVLFLLLFCLPAGCTKTEPEVTEKEGIDRVYYLNRSETALVYGEYEPKAAELEERLRELLGELATVPAGSDYRAPMQGDYKLENIQLEGDQLVLSLSEDYRMLSPATEVLVRAAIVRTLTQEEGVAGVSMLIGGAPLTDGAGNTVGPMDAESFMDNEGEEVNAYASAELHLYFANETGDALVAVTENVVYNTNVPMERLVIEKLIEGPESGMDAAPTIPASTKLISVTVTDGVCFVNLDSAFQNGIGNVIPSVTIYSIVNSLAELSSVHRVQFMVNGESDLMFREMMDLKETYTRNLDLVE